MKKVIFYIEHFVVGGRERVILNIMNGLKSLGMSTELVIEKDKNEWSDVSPLVLEKCASDPISGSSSFLAKSFKLKEIVNSCDFFISNLGMFPYNKDIATYAKTLLFVSLLYHPNKILSICHTSMTEAYLSSNKKLSHYVNSNIFSVISICNAIKDIINKKYLLENVQTIYNSIDISAVQKIMNDKLDEKIDYKYLLAVGRLAEHEKNFSSLIKAYGNSILKDNNIKLVIVGDGEDRKKLEKIISKLKLKSDVILLGKKDNPFKYMKNALFMVMSSKFEGFPMVLGECLATGTPVISYDLQTGPNEIIVHEHNGLLVENQNEQKLTEAIDRLYSDKALYEKCKSNALESVKKFDVGVIIKEWEKLINDLSNNQNKQTLATDNVSYKNPHGEFTTQELLYYINCSLSYKNIVEYFEECIEKEPSTSTNNSDIKVCEDNIYDVVDRYCEVFQCSKDVKEMIEVNVASNVIIALLSLGISKSVIDNVLERSLKIYNENEAIIEVLISKNSIYQAIRDNKWYSFSSLSKKEKIEIMLNTAKDYVLEKTKKKNVIADKLLSKYNMIFNKVEN